MKIKSATPHANCSRTEIAPSVTVHVHSFVALLLTHSVLCCHGLMTTCFFCEVKIGICLLLIVSCVGSLFGTGSILSPRYSGDNLRAHEQFPTRSFQRSCCRECKYERIELHKELGRVLLTADELLSAI